MVKLNKTKPKRRGLLYDIRKNKYLYFMMIPAVVWWIIFRYIPIGGVWTAFTSFRFDMGVLRSPFVGLDNFQFIFRNERMLHLVRLTVIYSLAFMITGLISAVGLALLLSEIRSKYFKKVSHSMIFLPFFISWITVSFITFALFNNRSGALVHLLYSFGIEFNFLMTPWIWPPILIISAIWQGVGFGSIVYLAVLTGVDPGLHESAIMDGASVWKRIWYVSLPMLKPTIILLTIMGLSTILQSGGDQFFQLVGTNPVLHRVADTIDTYMLRQLLVPGPRINFSQLAALGFFQQLVGFVLIVTVNCIVKRTAPEHSIF